MILGPRGVCPRLPRSTLGPPCGRNTNRPGGRLPASQQTQNSLKWPGFVPLARRDRVSRSSAFTLLQAGLARTVESALHNLQHQEHPAGSKKGGHQLQGEICVLRGLRTGERPAPGVVPPDFAPRGAAVLLAVMRRPSQEGMAP